MKSRMKTLSVSFPQVVASGDLRVSKESLAVKITQGNFFECDPRINRENFPDPHFAPSPGACVSVSLVLYAFEKISCEEILDFAKNERRRLLFPGELIDLSKQYSMSLVKPTFALASLWNEHAACFRVMNDRRYLVLESVKELFESCYIPTVSL